MTRINLIPVQELTNKHLIAEKHEITRVFALAKNSKSPKIPNTYRMGTGHVTFFYDKLAFVVKRYEGLCDEIRKRGFVCNQIPSKELLVDMPTKFINDYSPTNIDIEISRNRILERLK